MNILRRLSSSSVFALAILLVSFVPFSPQVHGQVVRTAWTSIVSANSGKCLDIAGMQTTDNAAAVQWPCQFSVNEQWNVQPVGSGFNVSFQIIEEQTGKCLVPNKASKSRGAAIVQLACTGQPVELWNFTPAAKGYQIQSAFSGLCMTTSSDSVADNAAIQQQSCTDNTLVTWIIKSGLLTPAQYVTFQPNHSGECIVASGASAGNPVVQYPCAGVAAEQWRFVAFQGAYVIQSIATGNCFDISGASTAAGGPMIQWGCTGAANQLFTMMPTYTGSYQLKSVNSGMCLDLKAGTTTSGTQITQNPCANVNHQQWSISNATVPSKWTPVTPLAVNPIGVANLPNGKLMTWSAYDLYNYEADIGLSAGQTYTSIFDPIALQSGAATVTTTGSDMFCPGTANLFDGRILVNGGSSSPKTTIFDPVSGNWSVDATMNIPRGYEADTVLSNGSVLTLGGSWSGTQGGKSGELWTKGSGWKVLSNVPEDPYVGPDPAGYFRGDNHMWLFAQSNGKVFHAGPSAAMHWIDTSGTGTTTSAGTRADDAYSINGNAVMYDVGKILKAGGAPAYDNGIATTATYTINLNNGVNGVNVAKIAPMTYARGFSNGVALPSGQVLIVGGQTVTNAFTDTGAIFIPELWDPLTGIFQQLAPMQTPRTYHSTALLLPDGRVFVGGGGQCGAGCSANHFNTEILTPPYLLNADGSAAARPTVTSAPTTAARGSGILVSTDSPVVSFALMRLSSTTHTVNNDQRRIPLTVQGDSLNPGNNSYVLAIPGDAGVALPGYYMLFAINAQDVPSVAATIQIQ